MRPVFRDVLLIVFLALVCCFPIFGNVSFAPDDYRYLNQMQDLLSDGLNVRDLTVITNTWSQLWWFPPENEITFFRPVVIFSYLFDYLLWGLDARGYALTSILIHVLSSIVVYFVLMRILGLTSYALFGGLLFAVHPVHGEAVWYLTGRTDSLAALFWLLSFALYQRLGERKFFYPLSLACFSMALLAKESSLTLLFVLIAYDLFFPERESGCLARLKWKRYIGYAVFLLLYYLLRFSVAGEFFTSQLVYPYFYTPSRPGFTLHLGVMALLYLFNLTAGFHTQPFFTADDWFMDNLFSVYLVPLASAVLLLCACLLLLRGNRRFFFLIFFVFVTWLPYSILYTSERFLYLPSVGFAGILVLVYSGLELLAIPRARSLAKLFLVVLLVYYSVSLLHENADYSRHTCPEFIRSRFTQALKEKPAEGAYRIFVLNYFDDYVCSVFLEDIVRVHYSNNDLAVRILTANAGRSTLPTIEKTGANTLQVTSNPLFKSNFLGFQSRPLKAGDVIEMDYFTVTVLEASGGGVSRMRFTFNEPLNSQVFLLLDPEITRFTVLKL